MENKIKTPIRDILCVFAVQVFYCKAIFMCFLHEIKTIKYQFKEEEKNKTVIWGFKMGTFCHQGREKLTKRFNNALKNHKLYKKFNLKSRRRKNI